MAMVFLTRPEGENESLASLLAGLGAEVMIRPLIKLFAIEVTDRTKKLLETIDQQDAIAFVSKNSVRYALPLLETYWRKWPLGPRWLAVGSGTASELAVHGIYADYPIVPGSEALLDLPQLQAVSGARVLIVRGVGGRELLASKLARRGAEVVYLEVYRRTVVDDDDWLDIPADSVVVVTSLQAMGYLSLKLGDAAGRCRVVAASPRIASGGNRFKEITIAAGASDQALYDAIVKCL